jgi:hypothetical protein
MIVRADGRSVVRGLARGALMPGAALLVHQLRFELAFGGGAGLELARQGHSYLHSLVPWIVLLIGTGAGAFLWALGRALAGQRSLSRYTLSLAGLWIACSACLIGIYAAQELLEGFLATGHPAGLIGVFGYGGWWSIPVAACIGLVLATIFHGARWVLDEVARRYTPKAPSRARAGRAHRPRPRVAPWPRFLPLAGGWSDRGPPGGPARAA